LGVIRKGGLKEYVKQASDRELLGERHEGSDGWGWKRGGVLPRKHAPVSPVKGPLKPEGRGLAHIPRMQSERDRAKGGERAAGHLDSRQTVGGGEGTFARGSPTA